MFKKTIALRSYYTSILPCSVYVINNSSEGNVSHEFNARKQEECVHSLPRSPSERAPRSLRCVLLELIATEDLQRCGVRHGGGWRLEEFSAADDEQTDDEDAIGALGFVQPPEVFAHSLLFGRRTKCADDVDRRREPVGLVNVTRRRRAAGHTCTHAQTTCRVALVRARITPPTQQSSLLITIKHAPGTTHPVSRGMTRALHNCNTVLPSKTRFSMCSVKHALDVTNPIVPAKRQNSSFPVSQSNERQQKLYVIKTVPVYSVTL